MIPLARHAAIRWRRLLVMTLKELIQLGRDTGLMLFFAYAFTADIYIAGSGMNLELRNAATVVRDSDHSAASRELIYRFRPPHFRLEGEIADPREGIRLLDAGRAMVVLDIPPRFEASLLEGEPTAVQMQVDTTNSVFGLRAASYGAQIVGRYGLEVGLRRAGLAGEDELGPRIVEEHRVWFNPNQDETWFMSIQELLQMITLFSVLLAAIAMVREKERGTAEQLLVSPLTPFEIMFPKAAAMTAVILGATALALFGILRPIFGVPVKGSVALFFAITALYVFTTAGLGLFAATVARNQTQVAMMTILIILPMMLLSGSWTPPEAMPGWVQALMALSPLTYFLEATFGVLLKGAGLDLLWDSVLGMALLGGAVFGLGVWRFRRQFG